MKKYDVKLVAVDIDGTFVRSDYTYDVERFQKIFHKMKQCGCHFVVASGNQYYQLRDLFSGYYDELSFVAENGAFVKDQRQLVFTADIPRETVDLVIDVCREYPEISNVVCGLNSAYCERGSVDQDFFDLTNIYYHRLRCHKKYSIESYLFLFFLSHDVKCSEAPYEDMHDSSGLCFACTCLLKLLDDKIYTSHPFQHHLQKDRSHKQNCLMPHLKNAYGYIIHFLSSQGSLFQVR